MWLLHNEDRVRYDLSTGLMIHFAKKFGIRPEVVKVQWTLEDGKWFPAVSLPLPPGFTAEQVNEEIAATYKVARVELVKNAIENRKTRYHGVAA